MQELSRVTGCFKPCRNYLKPLSIFVLFNSKPIGIPAFSLKNRWYWSSNRLDVLSGYITDQKGFIVRLKVYKVIPFQPDHNMLCIYLDTGLNHFFLGLAVADDVAGLWSLLPLAATGLGRLWWALWLLRCCMCFCDAVEKGDASGMLAEGKGWPSSTGIWMDISFWISLRYGLSSTSQNEMACPDAPARPVLPIRCT